ncbi:MAG: hypothetical protein OEZ55_04730 [Nitrospinota bacterium]|nr:hypothetical protein [Nitrospinota bacterium]
MKKKEKVTGDNQNSEVPTNQIARYIFIIILALIAAYVALNSRTFRAIVGYKDTKVDISTEQTATPSAPTAKIKVDQDIETATAGMTGVESSGAPAGDIDVKQKATTAEGPVVGVKITKTTEKK